MAEYVAPNMALKHCIRCGYEFMRHRHAVYCGPCMVLRYAEKENAHKLVRRAVMRGDLPVVRSLRCHDCNAPAVAYDHRDYTKPLDVVPVCQSCNRKRGPAIFPEKAA